VWDKLAIPWIILSEERVPVFAATQVSSYLPVEKLLEKKIKAKPTWRSILEIRIRNEQISRLINLMVASVHDTVGTCQSSSAEAN